MTDDPKPDQPAPDAGGPSLASVTEIPSRRARVTEETLLWSRQHPPRASNGAPHPRDNPFKLPSFPPGVGPPKDQPNLAMDSSYNSMSGWAGDGAQYAAETMNDAYAEGMVFPGYSVLATLAQRAEFRVITETIASEMTREWIELKSVSQDESKTDKLKDLMDAIDRFKLQDVFRRAAESDGFFGRGHIFIDTGDTDDRDELTTSLGNGRDEVSRYKIKDNSIKSFRSVEAVWCYPTHYESVDPLKSGWYDPYQWYVMSKAVHKTRLMTFIGREVPDILKPAYAFGGLSMSQMVKPYVDNWIETRRSVADLVRAFSVFVLHTNMDAVTGIGGEDLFRRVQVFNNFKDNQGCLVIDKNNEEFSNVSVPISGLDALQAQAQEQMASISRIPIVKLLGIQPAGLNASSEGELISFYDWIHSFQETLFREHLTTCIDFIQLSEYGEIDDDITFDFKSLRQLDEGQKASIQSQTSQTHSTYVELGAVTAEEVRESLGLDPDSPYAGLDLSEPLPTPMGMPGMPPMPGMEMPGMPPGGPTGAPPGPPQGPPGASPAPGGPQPPPQTDMLSSPETKGFWKSPSWSRPRHNAQDDAEDEGELGLDISFGYDAKFDESKIHRDKGGEFASTGSSGGGSAKKGPPAPVGPAPEFKPTKKTGHLQPAPEDRKQLPAFLKNAKIPPAWRNLHVSPSSQEDMWASGFDRKNNQVYIFNPKFKAKKEANKFKRVEKLSRKIDGIIAQNERYMKSKNPATREAAAAQNLIMKMGLRPGSTRDTHADKQAYGATTLKGEHVVTDPDGKTHLQFVGKKGVSLDLPVDDKELAQDLRDRAKDAGPNGDLFNVNYSHLSSYVKTLGGGSFLVKDFRTHLGTTNAQRMVSGEQHVPSNAKEYKKMVTDVATKVSHMLGNTPSIALKSYIAPQVFSQWKAAAGVA